MKDLDLFYEAKYFKKLLVLLKNAIIIYEKPHEFSYSWNIYELHKEAINNFLNKNYFATIFFCSIGVEVFLNNYKGLENYKMKQRDKWIKLNIKSLAKAKKIGLPVNELLDSSEIQLLENIHNKHIPIFCMRRNKILHGDIEGLIRAKYDINLPEITILKQKINEDELHGYIFEGEMAAYDQLLKFQKFIINI
jgi:hypothetical protein